MTKTVFQLQKIFGGVEGLARSLDSSLKTGIDGSDKDLKERAKRYGANKVEPRLTKSFFELCLEPFEDTIL